MKWFLWAILFNCTMGPITALAQPNILSDKTIYICDDLAEWPPYIYFERIDNKKTDRIVGFSVDVIQAILSSQNINFEIRLLPWKRCLYEVERGENFQILLDASYSDERAEKFHISQPYYTSSPYYFYSKKHHPNGLDIQTAADLKKYRVSGISGYNYTNYGLSTEDVRATVETHEPLILQLHHNRADLFPEWFEIIQGFAKLGRDFLADENLGYAPVPGVDSTPFHIMFPKNELGLALKNIVDEGIAKLEASGKLQEMLQHYAQ